MVATTVKGAARIVPVLIGLTFSALSETLAQTPQFSTYLGGSSFEFVTAIDSDDDGNIYLAGITASEDFPTLNSLQQFKGGDVAGVDIFVAEFAPSGEPVFSTLIGGTADELVNDIAVDADGAVWIAGGTSSEDFPVKMALQPFAGGPLVGADGFVLKLSPGAAQIEWASYIGGDGEEGVADIALDSMGNVYFVGATTSLDFPTTEDSFQPGFSTRGFFGLEAFFGKLVPDANMGYVLGFSSLLGGSADELGARIEVDGMGRPSVVGYTNSDDFPMADAFQAGLGSSDTTGGDVFLAILSADGASLEYGTFLGGDGDEQPTGLRVSDDGTVHLIGWTQSSDFPTTDDAFQDQLGGITDVFFTRLKPDSQKLTLDYSSYLGGMGFEQQFGKPIIDEQGRAYIAGITDNQSLPAIVGEFGGGLSDAFVYRFDPSSGVIDEATFIGGNDYEESAGLTRSVFGRTCMAVSTFSANLETLNAFQPELGNAEHESGGDAYLTCFGGSAVAVEDQSGIPDRFALYQNYPNPVDSETTIRFDLPRITQVELELFDAFGRHIETLIQGDLRAGRHQVPFDGSDLASGVYVYRIRGGLMEIARRMIVIH